MESTAPGPALAVVDAWDNQLMQESSLSLFLSINSTILQQWYNSKINIDFYADVILLLILLQALLFISL